MRRAAKAQAGRLLRVLLLRLGAMPAGSSSPLMSMNGTDRRAAWPVLRRPGSPRRPDLG